MQLLELFFSIPSCATGITCWVVYAVISLLCAINITTPLYYLNKISNVYNININYLVDLSNDKYIEFNKVEIDRIKLGKKIKEARKSINYTQEKLASKLNTTHSVISAYESGKSTVSTLFIIEIAKITNKSLNWLLDKI